MSLIQMQDRHVAALEPIYRAGHKRGYIDGALRHQLHNENYRHIDEMIAAGYSKREAAASSIQCNDMAGLNVRFEIEWNKGLA